MYIKDVEDEQMNILNDMAFSTPTAAGHEVTLHPKYTRITTENRHEYVKLALTYR